jgi:uncharacterized protein (DUF1697 family)
MPIYIAMMRAVNVAQNPLGMQRLRELCLKLGFRNAKTYIQSGNVVFEADGCAATLARDLEHELAGTMRLPVSAMIRASTEMGQVIARNPFSKYRGEESKLHVTFLREPPKLSAVTMPGALNGAEGDEFYIVDREVYLYCPNGYGRTKLSNAHLEKRLGSVATTRTWKTVTRLYEMSRR